MTDKMARFAQKVNAYVANIDAYNYSATMQQAQHDKEFENFVQSMTIDRIVNKATELTKRKYRFEYKRKDV